MLPPAKVHEALGSGHWTYPVYAACREWALAGARSVRIDADASEDVAGEVILELFEDPPRLDDPSRLPAYIGTMARRLAWKRRDRQVREQSDEAALEARLAETVLAQPLDRVAEALTSATRTAVRDWIGRRPPERVELLAGLLADRETAPDARQDWRELLNGLRGVAQLGPKAWRTEPAAERRQFNELRRRLGALSEAELERLLLHRRSEPRWPEERQVTVLWRDRQLPAAQFDRSATGLGLRLRTELRIQPGSTLLVESEGQRLAYRVQRCEGGELGLSAAST